MALFYSRPEARERLRLRQFGWHMREHPGDYEPGTPWQTSRSATRFECGSPNMLGIHALDASLGLLHEQGMARIGEAILERSRLLTAWAVDHPGFSVLSPTDPARQSGIVTLRHARVPAHRLHEHLGRAGVMCALRGGGVRLSPHFYTPVAQLEETCRLLEQAATGA